jgi:hypothetical protein
MNYPDLLVLQAKVNVTFTKDDLAFLKSEMQRDYMGKLCMLPTNYIYSGKRRLPTLADF